MEADFSGYATKAGLKCSDGRVIMPDAFKHQDNMRVPLVWQHGHNDPENVLGHAILENRADGVYCYGFFNESGKAAHARGLVAHKDVTMLSIWANDLIERAKHVIHGVIREVSLVLSGANPGAVIENVTLRHSDGEEDTLEDEAIIYTGLSFEHAVTSGEKKAEIKTEPKPEIKTEIKTEVQPEEIDVEHQDGGEKTVQDIYDSMTQEQKDVLHFMIGQALENSDTNSDTSLQQDNVGGDDDKDKDTQKGSEMKHNVFENKDDEKGETYHLSHDDIRGIVADATKTGSLRESVENFALSHGITDIDVLFPDAQALNQVPEFLSRRMEWVTGWLTSTRKSPFSRIKTVMADITVDEARAKGYVKGALKKEEFFGVAKRVTTPTTIYKKQQLDRDDVVDITDFDVVVWLKAEMRVMLDEELARAALIGDGRDVADGDKINEGNVRPISKDHDLYVTTVTVNLKDASSSIQEFIDAVVEHRASYKGTGLPNLYTTETWIAKFLLLKDSLGRRIYRTLDEVATELRVAAIIPVEAMEDEPNIIGIMVNPVDYVYGATRGGEVNLFDDFDIDYNQYKYLIETRCCGALTRLKSAMVFRQSAAGTDVAVTPNDPTFVSSTGVVTIVATTGVTYKNDDTDATLSTGAQTAIAADSIINIRAEANSGYYIPDTADSFWTFRRDA